MTRGRLVVISVLGWIASLTAASLAFTDPPEGGAYALVVLGVCGLLVGIVAGMLASETDP